MASLAKKVRNAMEVVDPYLPLVEVVLGTFAAQQGRYRKQLQAAQIATFVVKRVADKALTVDMTPKQDALVPVDRAAVAADINKQLDALIDTILKY
jgi:hypothetical protein